MVFEDYYKEFFKNRKSLESPYDKITISENEYRKLREIADNYERLIEKLKDIEAKNSELQNQLKLMKNEAKGLKDLEEKTQKYLNSLARVQADFENYRKSTQRENERYRIRIKEEMLRKLIYHYEDLQRALKVINTIKDNENIKNGFEMIVKNFGKFLKEEGVQPMNCVGEKFDPYKHEALIVEKDEQLPDNTIIEELDKGYYLNNKILKPAGVKISKLKSK